ncbi:hypothetical protein L210DRAFT_2435630 [Boletus edulis BED1]|uniref:Uncharacterized protein n=1 Tax=Boletus edulis BED1 TaxID=1328754 RepID=A0AAD4GC56_BOLED|nr:hypothetical protein L210DRAFT_2435630 [Boletus edulis BED1]
MAHRAHASHTLEVRMRLPPPSTSFASVLVTVSSAGTAPVKPLARKMWAGTKYAGEIGRRYDIVRRVGGRMPGGMMRQHTWYVFFLHSSVNYPMFLIRYWFRQECIPPQYRTVGSIARFAEILLSETPTEAITELYLRVQCITFPPHYLDKPRDTPLSPFQPSQMSKLSFARDLGGAAYLSPATTTTTTT